MPDALDIELISQTPLFSGLGPEFVSRAALLAEITLFAAGQTIFAEGESTGGLGVLLSGKAQVYKAAGESRVLVSVLEPPAMTGASCLFMRGARAVTEVLAVKACRLALFGEDALRALMRENFALAENYMRYLSGRVRYLTGRIESIGSPGAAEKLMNYLALNARDGALALPMGFKALADALCVSRASLYRVLDALEAEGSLRRDGKTIYLLHKEEP
ncbi:MAG TPA: Crp/Fnr family transcriptional regulator [Clostridia bacterium]|nr:Crp/Fnr family transcriptional regulator [Clostridia bacterium]